MTQGEAGSEIVNAADILFLICFALAFDSSEG